jgi:hypothetical protein
MFNMASYQLVFFNQVLTKDPPEGPMHTPDHPASPPIGSLQGIMTHFPAQINFGTGPSGVTYEATLTLKPKPGPLPPAGVPVMPVPFRCTLPGKHREKEEKSTVPIERDARGLKLLENMKRSPYLSAGPPKFSTRSKLRFMSAEEQAVSEFENRKGDDLHLEVDLEGLNKRLKELQDNRLGGQVSPEEIDIKMRLERIKATRAARKAAQEERRAKITASSREESPEAPRIATKEEAREEVDNLLHRVRNIGSNRLFG